MAQDSVALHCMSQHCIALHRNPFRPLSSVALHCIPHIYTFAYSWETQYTTLLESVLVSKVIAIWRYEAMCDLFITRLTLITTPLPLRTRISRCRRGAKITVPPRLAWCRMFLCTRDPWTPACIQSMWVEFGVETKPKLNFHDGEERKRGEEVANKTCTQEWLLMCRRSLNLTVYSKRVG